jgi:hypothetical protein
MTTISNFRISKSIEKINLPSNIECGILILFFTITALSIIPIIISVGYYFGFFANFGTPLFNLEIFIYISADVIVIMTIYIKILKDYNNF